MKSPALVQQILDAAPWAAQILLSLAILYGIFTLAEVFCSGSALWKFGPRYWRVKRKLDRRQFTKGQKT